MVGFGFERECRTPHSECFTILEGEELVGRVDIHFTSSVIHATLTVAERLTTERIQYLIDRIDRELMDSLGITRQEVIVHVHQGRDLGVFSTGGHEFDGNGGYERTS